MDLDATITIVGYGLVVNHPVAVIHDALTKAGYKVGMCNFAGQFQYDSAEDWPQNALEKGVVREKRKIKIDVTPLPWPG